MMKASPLLLTVSAFPLACYAALAGSAVHTYFAIGHWPSYNNPDPHHLPIYPIACLAALAGLIGVVACPLAVLLIAAVRPSRETDSLGLVGVVYAAGALLWVLDFVRWRDSSGGLVNWIFD